MSVGDRDYKQIVRDAIDDLGEDIQLKIDTKDSNTIYLNEATRCLRRSFYDRTDPVVLNRHNSTKYWEDYFEK